MGSGTGVDLGSGGTEGAFLLALDAGDGSRVFDRRFGAVGTWFREVEADSEGVVAVGGFGEPIDWGSGERQPSGSGSAVLARFTHDGAPVWDHVYHATGASSSRRVDFLALALHGTDIIVGGSYGSGTPSFGAGLPATGGVHAFAARLTPAGASVWAQALTTDAGARAVVASVAVDGAGRAYAVGTYIGGFAPGGGGPYSADDLNAFVTAYSEMGDVRWSRSIGQPACVPAMPDTCGDELGARVLLDATGEVVIVGSFGSTVNFGGGARSPTPSGSDNGFLARYTASGAHVRDARYSSGGDTEVTDLAIGPGNSTAICGYFRGSVDFGSGTRTSSGLADAFLLRLGT